MAASRWASGCASLRARPEPCCSKLRMQNEELRMKQSVLGRRRNSSFFILHSAFIRLQLLRLLSLLARPLARRPTSTISRILYIKPDHLGDLLLATPALAALRQRLP